MVPGSRPTPRSRDAAPRVRGWPRARPQLDLLGVLLLASAGMVPRGPGHHRLAVLLPAPAGMGPLRSLQGEGAAPAPRARGDGPITETSSLRGSSAPRAGGDDPRPFFRYCRGTPCSPSAWGMAPWRTCAVSWSATVSRSGGGGPKAGWRVYNAWLCSPRSRGWPHRDGGPRRRDDLFPASAGMDSHPGAACSPGRAASRPCGGGPLLSMRRSPAARCSLRPQGWSAARLSLAPASTCSPRPRGWTPLPDRPGAPQRLPPVPAGIGLFFSQPHRGRGDLLSAPWGWSPRWGAAGSPTKLLPARAGVFGSRSLESLFRADGGWFVCFGESCLGGGCRRVELQVRQSAPRARGDGPPTFPATFRGSRCSPRPRGWSRTVRLEGGGAGPAPRARRDGPMPRT